MTKHRIAVCQMVQSQSKSSNLERALLLVDDAVKQQAEFVFLPENVDFFSDTKQAEPLDYEDPFLIGGVHLLSPEGKVNLAHLIIEPSFGSIVARYDKSNLFNYPELALYESKYIEAGNRLPLPVETPIGKVGLAICVDLRYSRVADFYRRAGATCLLFPSSFTKKTGALHWHALLRARAIETQSFVIAAAQVGVCENRAAFGHALVVGPRGDILCDCGDEEKDCICVVEIDLDEVENVRHELPMTYRYDLYDEIDLETKCAVIPDDFRFGSVPIPPETIFYASRYSVAFVNLKPVLKGHVLIAPIRSNIRRVVEI
ncbi:hypothetical protein ACOME3_002796 [Neoechinorhynchus agilis]